MDPISILLTARAIERILIILVSGLCIVLGWHLFSKRLGEAGEADLGYDKIKLVLRRIGPGVFFALFGASLLAVSLAKPVTVEVTDNSKLSQLVVDATVVRTQNANATNVSRSIKVIGAGENVAKEQLRQDVKALNTALRVATARAADSNALRAAVADLSAATTELTALRDSLIVKALGSEEYHFWRSNKDKFLENPSSFSPIDHERLADVQSWVDETLIR